MEDMTSEYIDYFGLTPDKLKKNHSLIGRKTCTSRIRWSRGNRSNPHFLKHYLSEISIFPLDWKSL